MTEADFVGVFTQSHFGQLVKLLRPMISYLDWYSMSFSVMLFLTRWSDHFLSHIHSLWNHWLTDKEHIICSHQLLLLACENRNLLCMYDSEERKVLIKCYKIIWISSNNKQYHSRPISDISSNHKQFVSQSLNSLGCLQFISILRFISAYFSDSFAYKQTCGEKLQVELTLWTRVKPAGITLCNLL